MWQFIGEHTTWLLQWLVFTNVHYIPVVGVGKERRIKIGPWWWNLKRQNPLVQLPWGLLALCRRTLGTERHRFGTAWPEKLGKKARWRLTVYIWTRSQKAGGIPWVSTRFSLSMEMSGLKRDATAEPVSRDQIFRRERRPEKKKKLFSSLRAGLPALPGWPIICWKCRKYICNTLNPLTTPSYNPLRSSIFATAAFCRVAQPTNQRSRRFRTPT